MARPHNPGRRVELLDQVVDWLCAHGIGALSLRPLAADLEVSTYVLTYHFGSKEQLLAAAVEHVEDGHRLLVAALAAECPGDDLGLLLQRCWAAMTTDDRLARLRLVLEAATLTPTATGLPGDLRSGLVTWWVDDVARAVRPDDPASAVAPATLVVAALSGLLLDVLVTGDHERAGAGLDLLCRLLAPAGRST